MKFDEVDLGIKQTMERLIRAKQIEHDDVIEEVAQILKNSYPDNVNTNAFCAAIRSMKS